MASFILRRTHAATCNHHNQKSDADEARRMAVVAEKIAELFASHGFTFCSILPAKSHLQPACDCTI